MTSDRHVIARRPSGRRGNLPVRCMFLQCKSVNGTRRLPRRFAPRNDTEVITYCTNRCKLQIDADLVRSLSPKKGNPAEAAGRGDSLSIWFTQPNFIEIKVAKWLKLYKRCAIITPSATAPIQWGTISYFLKSGGRASFRKNQFLAQEYCALWCLEGQSIFYYEGEEP